MRPRRSCRSRALLLDYFSFLALLASVFVIAGGIYVKGEYAGTPMVNAIFLGLGAILANVIGTPGASMVLIRPFLRLRGSLSCRVDAPADQVSYLSAAI